VIVPTTLKRELGPPGLVWAGDETTGGADMVVVALAVVVVVTLAESEAERDAEAELVIEPLDAVMVFETDPLLETALRVEVSFADDADALLAEEADES